MASDPSAQPPDDQVRREVLLAAIGDIGRSINANDQKASAALVVHGLLFAGTVSIAGGLGDVYVDADDCDQLLMIGFLGAALVGFVLSVAFLLSAIRPYRPPAGLDRVDADYPGVFFPILHELPAEERLVKMRERVANLTTATAVNELSIEVVKLADILNHESQQAKRGYSWLWLELIGVFGFLIVAAINAG